MPPQSPKPILKEVVVAAWRNNAEDLCGLGCPTPFNEQDPNLMFTVLLDEDKKRIFARLGLSVMVKGGGSRKQRCFDFLVPLHSCNADAPSLSFHPMDVSEVGDQSVKAAVSEARLTKSGKLIRVDFILSQHGVVVTPWKEKARFSTCSDTSLDLLCGLFSLSESREFALYMCPSGYAEAGLTIVRNLLHIGGLQEWSPKTTGVYGGRNVMTVGREHIESGRKPRSREKDQSEKNRISASVADYISTLTEELPPYDPSKTHVPRSPPPSIFHRVASPCNSLLAEDSVLSDPGHAPEKGQPEDVTVVDGPSCPALGKRKRSDGERQAVRQALTRRLETWLCLAFRENDRVYEHNILKPFFDETLPTCVDKCDTDKFNVGIAFATAVLACDTRGGGELYWDHKEKFFELVDDMRALILWCLQRSENRDMLPSWRKLMDMGAAARTLLRTGERDAYDAIKAQITAASVLKGPRC
ncbi:putative lim domain-containing serine threonine-protein kinase [Diplodia corticola]|uniref:Putative lim domain-containing serine threonine-protein kinase n=1 Tax=Diplodia corticola TaxID=236234 RepID=A0A1J9RMA7_9PEZI|nr:putative lim domain-containing serine threonine-protein kinase [Diplodia corticola]OJD29647.1 putative lim domain-containing serine threonine-protein kinase [Diplodia corticola]